MPPHDHTDGMPEAENADTSQVNGEENSSGREPQHNERKTNTEQADLGENEGRYPRRQWCHHGIHESVDFSQGHPSPPVFLAKVSANAVAKASAKASEGNELNPLILTATRKSASKGPYAARCRVICSGTTGIHSFDEAAFSHGFGAAMDTAAKKLQARLQITLPEARLTPSRLPLAPIVRLWLLSADYPRGPLTEDVAAQVVAAPAYWAFCWGSGHAMAQWLLEHPEIVAGRRILDFGSGSGVAGIAAALAGAAEVHACDIDLDAQLATTANAELNQVAVTCWTNLADVPEVDLVLLADVLYDRANLPLLEQIKSRFPELLLADSRLAPELLPDWETCAMVEADTIPDLDESPIHRWIRFYRPRGQATGSAPAALLA